MALSFTVISLRLLTGAGGSLASAGRLQFDSCATGFRESNGDCLFGGRCAMLAFADVMHLLTYEFTRLSAGRLAFTRVLTRTLDGFSFRHKASLIQKGSTKRGAAGIRDSH
jgi:hypothetical protein